MFLGILQDLRAAGRSRGGRSPPAVPGAAGQRPPGMHRAHLHRAGPAAPAPGQQRPGEPAAFPAASHLAALLHWQ